MNTKDITKEQFDTLVLIRSLEEFITDGHENLKSLNEVIWTFEESLSDEEHGRLVKDICKLTESGYLLSDATEGHIKEDIIPDVEGITPKGKTVLDEFEQEVRGEVTSGNPVILFKNCSLFSLNLTGMEINSGIWNPIESLFKFIGKAIRS